MPSKLSLETVFLLAPCAEALCYGFFVCVFCSTMHLVFASPLGRQDNHSTVMVAVSCIMFFLATLHLAINCFRLVQGYVGSDGPMTYLGNQSRWDHVFKDTIYATQENFGNAVAIYRCFVLWDRRWRIVVFPACLFIVSLASGYAACVIFTKIAPDASIWDRELDIEILTFFSVAAVQNIITTSLMAYRIWTVARASIGHTTSPAILPVSRILVESASLQLLVEVVLLALYAANLSVQYILLECMTPVIGITFVMITVRVKLYRLKTFREGQIPVEDVSSFRVIDDLSRKSDISQQQFDVTRPDSQIEISV